VKTKSYRAELGNVGACSMAMLFAVEDFFMPSLQINLADNRKLTVTFCETY